MKKFKDGDIFYNVIKAYPKVRLFCNAGQGRYGKQNYPPASSGIPIESAGLFEHINPVYAGPSSGIEINNWILAENGDFLLAENGDNLILEG